MGAPVVYFEIIGTDASTLRTFYQDLFGWRIGERTQAAGTTDYTFVTSDSPAGIGGGIGAAPQGYDGHVTFYVGVPDVEEALCAIVAGGGTRILGPVTTPGGTVIGLFTDPEDHVVGLVQIAS